MNGFIEVYLDPRGIKGSWEALVFYVNQEKTARIKKLAENAQWFEDRMPWDPKYRKPSVQGIVANAIDVVVETGDSGPVTPIGINLPNDQTIREKYGSKSVALSNVNEAYDRSTPGGMRGEFSWTPEEAARAEKLAQFARRAHHRHARGDRPRVGPHGRRREGHAAGADQGGVLGARRRARRSRRPLLHRRSRSWSSSASSPAADHDDDRPRRVRGLHAQRARAAAPRARGHADRGRPHAQPPDDRALAAWPTRRRSRSARATARPIS